MRLTTFTDYSLRVLMYLAVRTEDRSTIAGIANAFNISENHLTKVVHFLGREGYLDNTRGRGGGLALARAPADINIGEVVQATEGNDVPAECFERETNRCSVTQECLLKFALAEAVRAFYATLGKYTLEDAVKNRKALVKVLFPVPVAAPASRKRA
jgi:Rrf2 family nitric oxide-sensitive transcriptional repressor